MSSSDEAKSALEENINRKGANSYYYAHGKKIDGPVWDGKEEPRLLSVSAAPAVAKKASHAIQFDSFSWLDETKNVKIFVDFENASDIPDADITLVSLAYSLYNDLDIDIHPGHHRRLWKMGPWSSA